MFGSIWGWFALHLTFQYSIVLMVLGLIWALALWLSDDSKDNPANPVAGIGVLGAIVAFFACIDGGGWAYWLPYIAGIAILPSILGVRKLIGVVLTAAEEAEEEAKRKAAIEATSPKSIIAKCEAIVKQYIATLPSDMSTVDERYQAQTKLDALRALYKRLEEAERLGPRSPESFAQNLKEADALYSDVSLEKECGELVRELRSQSEQDNLPVARIKLAIEALKLSISELPSRTRARIAEEIPHEYQRAAETVETEMGKPLFPSLIESPAVDPNPPRRRRAETA